MMNTTQFRTILEQRRGQKIQLELLIEKNKKTLRVNKRMLHRHEQAKEVLREVGMKTQQQLQYHISDITSLALEAVFKKPYTLEVEFVQRRNKTECDLFFVRDGNRVDPLFSSGGGTVDVASFALRIASWCLAIPRTRNTIVLDEPLKWIDETLKDKASAMIKEVSVKLGIQFIIVTHEPKLTAYANRVFTVAIKNRRSFVKSSG